jgi:hypothetical protein
VKSAPQLDLGPEAVGLTENPLGRALIVPEAGRARLRVELGDASLLGV